MENIDKNRNTEDAHLANAYALSLACRYAEALEGFLKTAEETTDPLTKAYALLLASDALVQMSETERAEQTLKSVRATLDVVHANSDREAIEEQRLEYMLQLQEIAVACAFGRRVEALERYRLFLKRGEDERVKPGLSDIYEKAEGEMTILLVDLNKPSEALPILEKLEMSQSGNAVLVSYLGTCCCVLDQPEKAVKKLKEAIRLGLPPHLVFRAHCTLGMAYYLLQDYANAKLELEEGVRTATPRYIKETEIWKWLEWSCIGLGLKTEAEEYGRMARPS
jgi:tetratricopeptide (TPR) repeat protein